MTKEEILEGIKGLTALELSELVHDLEEAFGVGIADEDMGTIKTVQDILTYIENKKQ